MSGKTAYYQPFTAPIIIPLVKYRWKNGYTRTIGTTTIMVTVIRVVTAFACVITLATLVEAVALFKAAAEEEAD